MRLRNLIIILLVITGLLLVKFFFFPAPSDEKNAVKQGKGGPVNVAVYIVVPEKLSNDVFAAGTVLANEEVQLQTELSGKIVQLNFREGAPVTKGQLLVKINDAELQAQFKKLQLQMDLAKIKLKRQEQLLSANAISQEEFDIVKNQHDVINAEIENINAQIQRTSIYAPFNGIVGLKNVSEGAYITPAVVIASIQQIDPVKIDFSISEKYAALVKKGDKLTFSLEGSDKKRNAQVFAIDPRIDLATRSLRVRALCPNSGGEIFPGAFARVELSLNDIDDAVMIPNESIIPELKGQKVYVVKNGKAEPVKVTTGLRTDTRIQIISGLAAGDTVITSGLMQLRKGSAVNVLEIKKD